MSELLPQDPDYDVNKPRWAVSTLKLPKPFVITPENLKGIPKKTSIWIGK